MIANLRSDTFTRPTPEMLEMMLSAEVGDDVFGEDPTINALEKKCAKLFEMEDAIFCASGTMANQIGIRIHTQPQDEVICDWRSHIFQYEGGGIASNAGVSVKLLEGDRGRITASQVASSINPDDIHKPVTRLVGLENTMNRGGGAFYDFQEIRSIREVCDAHQLALHLDGARLYNALVETAETPQDYGSVFDSISICLSKGLGAPVGSVLLSTREKIKKARRVRKVFGGAMRQAGYLAAACIYALDHHVDRLKDDHERARALGSTLEGCSFVQSVMPIDTNIVIYTLNDTIEMDEHLQTLDHQGVQVLPFGERDVRMITHLDFTDDMLEYTINVLRTL